MNNVLSKIFQTDAIQNLKPTYYLLADITYKVVPFYMHTQVHALSSLLDYA